MDFRTFAEVHFFILSVQKLYYCRSYVFYWFFGLNRQTIFWQWLLLAE